MSRRFLILVLFVAIVALLDAAMPLGSSQAVADRSTRTPGTASASPTVLDSAFGDNGSVRLPVEGIGSEVLGTGISGNRIVVSGGNALEEVAASGRSIDQFVSSPSLVSGLAEGAEFSVAGLTPDSAGRLLVVGTVRLPSAGNEGPHGSNGEVLAPPSTVRILRFLPDGALDSTFGHGGIVETDFGLPPPRDEKGHPLQAQASVETTGIAVGAGGSIVVTGGANVRLGPSCEHDIFQPLPVSVGFVARLTKDGAPDQSFGRAGLVGGRKLGEMPLRAGLVGEPIISSNGVITYRSVSVSACSWLHGRWGVSQMGPGGETNVRFGTNGVVGGFFSGLVGEPSGRVVAVAKAPQSEGSPFQAWVIRFSRNGSIDRSFGHDGQVRLRLGHPFGTELNSVVTDGRGRILLGGAFRSGRHRSLLLVRLTATGRPDPTFGPHGRVTTDVPGLIVGAPSSLFFDRHHRLLSVNRYQTGHGSGLLVVRFLIPR